MATRGGWLGGVWDERGRDGERTVVHRGVRKGFGPNIIDFLFPGEKKSQGCLTGIQASYGS